MILRGDDDGVGAVELRQTRGHGAGARWSHHLKSPRRCGAEPGGPVTSDTTLSRREIGTNVAPVVLRATFLERRLWPRNLDGAPPRSVDHTFRTRREDGHS